MSTWMEAGKTGDLAEGTMKGGSIRGRELLLARVGGQYYACDNRCSHMGGVLSKGRLEGTVVTCPRHGSQFDVTSGKVVRWLGEGGLLNALFKRLKSPRPIGSYPTRIEGDRIMVELPE